MIICGRQFSPELIARLEEAGGKLSRRALSGEICRWLDWKGPSGNWQTTNARIAIKRLERSGLLKLNASTIRERHKMRLKIKAASSEGRASAMILTSAPFIAVGMIMLISPAFYGDVIDEPLVKYGLAGMGFWIFLGNLIMRRMIDMRL